MRKAAFGVFIRATWRLDHAVQRDEFSDDKFSHVFPALMVDLSIVAARHKFHCVFEGAPAHSPLRENATAPKNEGRFYAMKNTTARIYAAIWSIRYIERFFTIIDLKTARFFAIRI